MAVRATAPRPASGRWRHRCGFRLGALCRRQRRHQDRSGAILVKVKTSAEVLHRLPSCSFTREGLLSRTYRHYVARVGLDYVKKKVPMTPLNRKALGSACSLR